MDGTAFGGAVQKVNQCFCIPHIGDIVFTCRIREAYGFAYSSDMRSTLVSLFAGLLFGGSWLALVDGIVQSHALTLPSPFWWYYALPAIFASVCAVCMNFTNWDQLKPGSSGAGAGFDDDLGGQRCKLIRSEAANASMRPVMVLLDPLKPR